MFSKVVPNLGKLGLLTERVRDGFEKLGILRYERYVDSATEAGELQPGEGAETTGDPFSTLRAQLAGVDRIPPGPVLTVLQSQVGPDTLANAEPASIRLDVSGVEDGDWTIRIGPDGLSVAPSTDGDPVDVTLRMDVGTFTDIVAGRVTPPGAVMEGRIGLEGDVMKALAFDGLL